MPSTTLDLRTLLGTALRGPETVDALQELRTFVGTALRRPGTVGAIAPSSAGLAELLASVVPSVDSRSVVELGPGTGVVSDAIARRLPAEARHTAVEVDPAMAAHLRATRPGIRVVTGDATELPELLADFGVHTADAVVSGLPWALFSPKRQHRIVRGIADLLEPGGAFSTFGYLHARPMPQARRFHQLLHATFDEVIVSRAVWRNLPPALVYICRRPRSGSPVERDGR